MDNELIYNEFKGKRLFSCCGSLILLTEEEIRNYKLSPEQWVYLEEIKKLRSNKNN